MKVVQINATCESGSTGKICLEVSKLLDSKGIENYVLYSHGDSRFKNGIKFSNGLVRNIQALLEKTFGFSGFMSYFSTLVLLFHLKRISPSIVHLHNIHTHDCDLRLLFNYLNKHKIKVFWTFHDCWAFTGGCTYFDASRCEKWKYVCSSCPQAGNNSWFFDRSQKLFNLKNKYIIPSNLHIITPSIWMAELVKKSFLKTKAISVINNGIDLTRFMPSESDFRKRYNLENKFVILGVSFVWENRKGLDVFIRLANELDSSFRIVLVGTDESVDEKLPPSIISIHRTENQKELVNIYSAADLFFIPTREENFPTVNIEALACGTPVVTFNTGGSPEIIDDTCGSIIKSNGFDESIKEITRIKRDRPFEKENCLKRAQMYSSTDSYQKYINLYLY